MYVDCMHTTDVPDIDKQMLDNITDYSLGACNLDGSKLVCLKVPLTLNNLAFLIVLG